MPKDMFFNISKIKREMFLNVAIDEFTSKSFEEVSVNAIVKKANISRGSFYTYFDDLEELFNYIFLSVKEKRFVYAKELINEADGDYFEFIRLLFSYDYDQYNKEGTYTLFRNYIHYIQVTKKVSLSDVLLNGSFLENIEHFSQYFNISKFNLSTDDFLDLIEVVVLIMINTFIKSESENLSKEDVILLFNKRLSYIEYGVKKK